MGMLGNNARLNFGAGRPFGSAASVTPGGRRNKGEWAFWTAQSGASTVLATEAKPTGYYSPATYYQPITAGGMSMQMAGSATLAANLFPAKQMTVDLTGSGDLTGTAGLVVSMLAALAGEGTLTATIQGRRAMTVDLTGTGGFAGGMQAVASMVAILTGSGDLDAVIRAYGDMTVDIVVTGSGLTTANVGPAVWAALASQNNDPGTMGEKLNDAGSASNPWTEVIESGYTAAEILRLLAAVAQGNATGLEDGSPVFKGIDGTTDRVTATYADGTRVIVSRDAS
jgi:hypothetical protein